MKEVPVGVTTTLPPGPNERSVATPGGICAEKSVAVGVQGHDDVELVEAARSGDPESAFGRLFDRWFDRTYDVAWRIVRNPDTAAEVAQDSFLARGRSWPRCANPCRRRLGAAHRPPGAEPARLARPPARSPATKRP